MRPEPQAVPLTVAQIAAANHDADAVLKYGNDAPNMRVVLAKHLREVLDALAVREAELASYRKIAPMAGQLTAEWMTRSEAAEADNARLRTVLRSLAITTPRVSIQAEGIKHVHHCEVCKSLWINLDERHEDGCEAARNPGGGE